MMISLQQLAQALGGEIANGQVLAPGPGHTPKDRSMAVKLSPEAPEGFVVYSFAEDDINACRDYVRGRIGMPAFEPSRKPNGKAGSKAPAAAKEYKCSPEMEALLAANAAAISQRQGNQLSRGQVTHVYDYKDHSGGLVFQVLRYEPKGFSQRRPDPDHPGGWINNLQGVDRVPYRLPDVLQFPDATLFICEGEKDADNCAALGLCATTAAGSKWTESCIRALTGREKPFAYHDDRSTARDIVILQDNDEAGRRKALAAAEALHGYAKTVRVVLLPGLPPDGGDLTDWLDDTAARPRHDRDLLVQLCLETAAWVPDQQLDETAAGANGTETSAAGPHAAGATKPETMATGEDALALQFAEQHHGYLVFDHTRGTWFRWDTTVWRRDSDQYVLDCVRVLIRQHKLGQIRTATAVERAARTDRRLARDHTAWNTDSYLLGTPSDVIDLRSGEHLPPDAAYMINQSASVSPAPRGTPHPLWTQFLSEATCDDLELQRYLQQRAGYWLTGDTCREDFDFFHGPGGSGKGTFLRTVSAVMGDYAMAAPIAQFMATKTEAHPCELARLVDARLVIAGEPEENRSWAVGKIKMLTGNEGRIAARHLHQAFFEFVPRFKLVFAGNAKPRISVVDQAIARRLNLVPFRYQPTKRDERLKDRLTAEYPAILRWMIDGWLDLQAEGPIRPTAIADATIEYLDNENAIAGWLTERCVQGRERSQLLKELFADWKQWCETNAEDPETNRKFQRRLDRLPGVRFVRDKHGVWVKGLALEH